MGITKVNDLAAVFVATVLLLSICPANGGIYRSQDALIFKIDRAADGSFSPKLFPIKQSDFLPINFFLIGGLIKPEFLPELNRPRQNTNLYYSNIGPHHPLQELNLYNWLILHPFIFEGVHAAASPPALNSSKDQQTFNREFKEESSIPCGVGPNTNRIVNGQEAVPNSWPFVVGFKTLGSNTVFCGGSLISETEILTAAHCFERLSLYQLSRNIVKLGMHDRGNDDGGTDDALETIKISSLTIHRMFNRRSFDYDVAIITMEQPVTYSSAISRVCLPSGMEQIDDFAGKSANVMGWGTTSFGTGLYPSKLRQAMVPIITKDECTQIYSQPNEITSNMLCASASQSDSCQGDSGGPLVVQSVDGSWTQVGIVSWGYGCADPEYPAGVYANVPGLSSWINKYMGQK